MRSPRGAGSSNRRRRSRATAISRSTRTGRSCNGRTRSSAASISLNRSQPCFDAHPLEHGDRALRAVRCQRPRPCRQARRRREPRPPRCRRRCWRRPASGCDGVWTPISVSGFSASRNARDALGILRRQQRAGRVGHVDALGAVALHQLRLLDELLGRRSCAPSSGSRPCPCRACARPRYAASRHRPRCNASRHARCARLEKDTIASDGGSYDIIVIMMQVAV